MVTPMQQAAMKQALKALEAMTAKGRIPPTAKAFHSAAYAITVLRQALADEQQAEPFNTWSSNDGDSWYDDPADAQIINDVFGGDIPVIGDEYEVLAGWRCVTARYRIAFVSGDGDCEVDCISHPHPQPAQQPAIPAGYKLVPVEPTKEMIRAGDVCWQKMALGEETYRAMLAAAPEAPALQPLTDEQMAYCIFEARLGADGALKRDGSSSYRIARSIESAHGIK